MSFYSSIAKYYDHIFPLKMPQVDFVLDHGKNRDIILDVGCSTGKLSMELMERGRQVIGIDLDPEMVAIGRRGACCGVKIMLGDMLKIEDEFGKNAFDQIVCFGNTLVHLPERSDVLDFFKQVHTALDENGRFACQIINYDRIIDQNIDSLSTIENEHVRFERKYRIASNKQVVDFDTTLFDKTSGKTIINSQKLLALRKAEVEEMLQQAGFSSMNFYSSFKKEEYNTESQPLVFQAFKE